MDKVKVSYNGMVKYFMAVCEEHAIRQFIDDQPITIDKKFCHAEFCCERGLFPYLFNQDEHGLKAFVERTGFDIVRYRMYVCRSKIDKRFLNKVYGEMGFNG